jgi:hypothetical protein
LIASTLDLAQDAVLLFFLLEQPAKTH